MTALAKALAGADRSHIAGFLADKGLYVFLIVLIALGGLISPSFVSANNVNNMLVQFAPLAIVVIGQSFVIISRGLDLSVASIMATAAITTTMFQTGGSPEALIVLASLGVGIGTGLINGLLVTKRNVSPFLATLATAIMLQGLRFAATAGAPLAISRRSSSASAPATFSGSRCPC
jgi:ribose/xylose/arabinose/galactoside ABC-type transport system permease subunit